MASIAEIVKARYNNSVSPSKENAEQSDLEPIDEEGSKKAKKIEICDKCNQPIGGHLPRKKKKKIKKVDNCDFFSSCLDSIPSLYYKAENILLEFIGKFYV